MLARTTFLNHAPSLSRICNSDNTGCQRRMPVQVNNAWDETGNYWEIINTHFSEAISNIENDKLSGTKI